MLPQLLTELREVFFTQVLNLMLQNSSTGWTYYGIVLSMAIHL
jgi:hypothetical protein